MARAYLISLIEERHGWIIAFLLSTLLFFAAHLSHAYASLAFVPFFLAHSAILTLLVYFTRSILPSIVIHTVSDFIVLPIQYGLIGQRLPMLMVGHLPNRGREKFRTTLRNEPI